jgi:hypothetical protein
MAHQFSRARIAQLFERAGFGIGSWCGREIRQFALIQTVVPVFCQGFGNYFWQRV